MKRLIAVLFLAGALSITPAFAFEGPEKASESSERPGMEAWKWANFILLAGLLGYLISKNLGPMLVERSREIQDGLAAGVKAKAEADARAVAVQSRLAGLGAVVAQLKAEALRDREREAARIRREADLELDRLSRHEAFEIETAGKMARLEIRREAARLAIELAERKLRARMSPDAQSELLATFADDLARESAKARTSPRTTQG